MDELISRNIRRMQQELGPDYFKVSASGLAFRKVFPELLESYACGKLLDAGAGNLLYRDLLEDHCESYESLDVEERNGIDHVQDIQDTQLKSGLYDTIFCRNVIEHVEKPRAAMSEISRLLKDDGKAIISVPHLAYLHNEPEDYYRFTEYGLAEIASDTDLELVEIRSVGGFFSFLGYIFSTGLMGLTYDVPVLSWFAYRVNLLFQYTCFLLDSILKTEKYLPLNYVAVFQKEQQS